MTTATPNTVDGIYDDLQTAFNDASPRASGYLSNFSFFRERGLVLGALGDVRGKTVLDLACGAGLMTAPLVAAGARVVGADFNAGACGHALRRGLGAVRADAFQLPLASDAVDRVVNVEFAQQYDRAAIDALLGETARVLRPAGRLVMVWSHRAAWIHRIAGVALRLPGPWREVTRFELFAHAPAAMRAAAVAAGLRARDLYAIFPPLRLRLRNPAGLAARAIGSSFIGVFEKAA